MKMFFKKGSKNKYKDDGGTLLVVVCLKQFTGLFQNQLKVDFPEIL